MSDNTFTQIWEVIYENEIETWEVEGWSDFASEHDEETYNTLDTLGGLTDKGTECLLTNHITTTSELLGHALVHCDDIQAWLVSLGFKETEDGFPDFATGLYRRLARADMVPASDSDDEEEDLTEQQGQWCVLS